MKREDVKKAIGNRGGREFIDNFLLELAERKEKYYQPKIDALDKRIEKLLDTEVEGSDKVAAKRKEVEQLQDRKYELDAEGREKLQTITAAIAGFVANCLK